MGLLMAAGREPEPQEAEPGGLEKGDRVEVVVGGPPTLNELWAFVGSRGVVVRTYRERGYPMATVMLNSSASASRNGKQWFPTMMLKKVGL